jgi:hypothetical protein
MSVRGRRNGDAYELVDETGVLRSIPLAEAIADTKLAAAIKRNKWPPVLADGEVPS